MVAPAARGRGVGTGILDVLLLPAMDDRAWAVTDHQDTPRRSSSSLHGTRCCPRSLCCRSTNPAC
ncbi:hypothetical protein ACFRH4_14505 [Streptomyces mirabilis]|uniref:hypothetical protein n=1 Tax=Streptomyces mirabilis TaxID=68239 RepID=UPI0036C48DC1